MILVPSALMLKQELPAIFYSKKRRRKKKKERENQNKYDQVVQCVSFYLLKHTW